jgi:hypothetical protein
MNIHAIRTENRKPFDIAAAKASPELRSISRLPAAAKIEEPTRRLSQSEVDLKLQVSSLTIQERIHSRACSLASA